MGKSEVFPAPVAPSIASTVPASARSDTSRKTSLPPRMQVRESASRDARALKREGFQDKTRCHGPRMRATQVRLPQFGGGFSLLCASAALRAKSFSRRAAETQRENLNRYG